jgi:putative flippase GtrA
LNQLLKYLLVGLWNASFSLATFYALLFALSGKRYQLALLISFLLSTLQSYSSQSFFVWHTSIRSLRRFFHFFVVCLAQYAINAIGLFLLVKLTSLNPGILQIPVAFTVALGSFVYLRLKVFRITGEFHATN